MLFVDDTSADLPKPQCYFERIDFSLLPPRHLVADLVILPVMCSAQWHYKLIAVFAPHCSKLGKAEMVRIRRAATTQQARLQGDKPEVGFVPVTADLAEPEHALVDLDDRAGIQVAC
jgi:hypothetical protein